METLKELLKYVSIFSELKDEELEHIVKTGKEKFYRKDSVILFEHESSSTLLILIKGKAKISHFSEDNKKITSSILSESDIFGEMSLFTGSARSSHVTAEENTRAFLIKREDFIEYLHNFPELAITLLQEMTKRIRAADIKIKSLALKNAEGKIAAVLLQIADEIGKIKHDTIEIEKLPVQHDLASLAGTSRETISRTLHSFAKRGFVELDRNKLKIIDYKAFKEAFIQ